MIENFAHIRWFGLKNYADIWQAMQTFTASRGEETPDEIWLLEHPSVFTQGQNGKPEHILNPGIIPIIQTDRGGQVTYHGPGQLMVYVLLDLNRKKWTIRELVSLLEEAIISYLAKFQVLAFAKKEAPGVYVQESQQIKKICSIGLRVKRGCAYHGIAFNMNMDLTPFTYIHPCGFSGLQMTQLINLVSTGKLNYSDLPTLARELVPYLTEKLRYTKTQLHYS